MFANMYLTKEEYLEYIKNSKNSTINQTMKIHNGQKAFYQSGYIVSKWAPTGGGGVREGQMFSITSHYRNACYNKTELSLQSYRNM